MTSGAGPGREDDCGQETLAEARPRLPINRENLDRLTLALEKMADEASIAARRAEPVLRRALERMAQHRTAALLPAPVVQPPGTDEEEGT